MKPVGAITRGTTNPNRLRRFDRWIAHTYPELLGLVVDLGYGASPITTVEMHRRLRPLRTVGLEIDPERVAAARPYTEKGLEFRRGGFELAGLRPTLIRACNVLRQYEESAVVEAWGAMTSALQPGGVLVEGTCDELGRICSWFAVTKDGPVSVTFSVSLNHLERPAVIAERLPKALIHRNVPGEPVHALLSALDNAWLNAAPYKAFGPRERWVRSVRTLKDAGWPVRDRPRRWRLGELTLDQHGFGMEVDAEPRPDSRFDLLGQR
ncbi:SAM-dependent methyltransferase [Longispora albida]|uniref:SAM-dependent methyltransferase n=1 Tax=Longispora albida TaxID=203523 RepID=UPI00036AF0FA|nr:SAM-dependent methyltransferase [Longispora albida]